MASRQELGGLDGCGFRLATAIPKPLKLRALGKGFLFLVVKAHHRPVLRGHQCVFGGFDDGICSIDDFRLYVVGVANFDFLKCACLRDERIQATHPEKAGHQFVNAGAVMLWLKEGFNFSGGWIVNDHNDLFAHLFGLQNINIWCGPPRNEVILPSLRFAICGDGGPIMDGSHTHV